MTQASAPAFAAPHVRRLLLPWIVGALSVVSQAHAEPGRDATAKSWADRVQADWIIAERLATITTLISTPATTTSDAAGGCDGIKNGEWGFHTGETTEPWWQVDLGSNQPIARIVIWNRPQFPERAARLQVKLSQDGHAWHAAYQHNGTTFVGFPDQKPLCLTLPNPSARWVRIQLPQKTFLHLEEVEVFGPEVPERNLALHQPADQVSVSEWSHHHATPKPIAWKERAAQTLANVRRLTAELRDAGIDMTRELAAIDQAATTLARDETPSQDPETPPATFLQLRTLQRQLALRNPLLDFDSLLFVKRAPASFNHMSDQYYGWWSQPGGGIYLLHDVFSNGPREECLTPSFTAPGSFLRPTLSYDGRKVLFAWCRHYPTLAGESNKLDKARVPEDAFYHLFEMNVDGSDLRQLTHGKYDDFDGRYLPDGRIVFLSTRRGQAVQVGRDTAARSVARPDLPDCYVRCGGGPERPVAVYTLHTMNADGTGLYPISPFEMFEWTPEIGADGSILYSRWDYIDRDNMPYMGLWAMNPDGSNLRLVFKNYTKAPHCVFEAKPIPGSHRLIFTASGHHAQTMGSLVLLDTRVGLEGTDPMTRLTPEVPFPEIEGWPITSYANPWPLSERQHLVAWGFEGARIPGPNGWNRWHAVGRPINGMALYLYDAALRSRELLWSDPEIACSDPIPLRTRERPPILASTLAADPQTVEGRVLLANVTEGLPGIQPGDIRALRIVAVPPKTHPTMNFPALGITADDPGKCVLGTVPVEPDGSAFFRVPAGMTLFFQALDADGLAVQTMRSATHVQPGQTLSCLGCHEPRQQAPPPRMALAAARPPSRIAPGPDGSWPFRFDRLVQPVLDRHCVSCHSPNSPDPKAAPFDLTSAKAYHSLVTYGKPSLRDLVWTGYRQGASIPGQGIAHQSALRQLLDAKPAHYQVQLSAEDRERLLTWMDTYAQQLGHFSDDQEQELLRLRAKVADLLDDRPAAPRADLHPPPDTPGDTLPAVHHTSNAGAGNTRRISSSR